MLHFLLSNVQLVRKWAMIKKVPKVINRWMRSLGRGAEQTGERRGQMQGKKFPKAHLWRL